MTTGTHSERRGGPRIFYAVPEFFPAWRLDVGHLFGEQLPRRGVVVAWSMWRDGAGRCEAKQWRGQRLFLSGSLGRRGTPARLFDRIARAGCEVRLFAGVLARGGYDIIQVRDVRYLAALLGWLAARLRGAKFIYWLSYPFPEHYLEWSRTGTGAARWVRRLQGSLSFRFVYRWLVHRADHLFVQSEQMKRDLIAYGVPPAKMTPVPMGVPPALLQWVARERPPVVPGRVVYVGTLARVRRLETVIEAFAQLSSRVPAATLLMVGEGDFPSERAFLEAEAERLGVRARVQFTGFVPMEEAWRHAASAQVCVSPFYPTFVLRSTSPTKLVEYLALGRPVVANDHPEQSAIIAASGGGLCVPWGAAAFAEAIARILEQPVEADAMGARGAAWVARHRSYDLIADELHACYRGLLEPPAPREPAEMM